jgi:predicted nucleic acid-binding protein
VKFLLDTMVLSEAAKPAPNAGVRVWLEAQPADDLAVSVLTFGEIQRGIARMPDSKRRRALEKWFATELVAQFEQRLLAVDLEVAQAWGRFTAEADRVGRPLPTIDGLLLATAQVHSLTLVTRNVGDFVDRGVKVLNPYK